MNIHKSPEFVSFLQLLPSFVVLLPFIPLTIWGKWLILIPDSGVGVSLLGAFGAV